MHLTILRIMVGALTLATTGARAAEATQPGAMHDQRAATVMNTPGCVAFWDFVKREPEGAHRFTAHVPKGTTNDFTITGNLFLRSGALLDRGPELAEHERCAIRLVGVDGLTFTGNSTTVGGNDASMQKAAPTPECGLVVRKLDHAILTGNRLVGTRQALLDLGEHGEQVIIRDNLTALKPPATRSNN